MAPGHRLGDGRGRRYEQRVAKLTLMRPRAFRAKNEVFRGAAEVRFGRADQPLGALEEVGHTAAAAAGGRPRGGLATGRENFRGMGGCRACIMGTSFGHCDA